MFLLNNILAINLFQFGGQVTPSATYEIILQPRENDTIYTGEFVPTEATERLYRFDVTSLNIPEAMFDCTINLSGVLITKFGVRTTKNLDFEYYESGITDSTYGD